LACPKIYVQLLNERFNPVSERRRTRLRKSRDVGNLVRVVNG
jgi:hypothetical protein